MDFKGHPVARRSRHELYTCNARTFLNYEYVVKKTRKQEESGETPAAASAAVAEKPKSKSDWGLLAGKQASEAPPAPKMEVKTPVKKKSTWDSIFG